MVYHDKQLIHIHPPLTGGRAIQQALGIDPNVTWHNGVWRHESLEGIYRQYPVSREYKVAISVREPRARLLSFYYAIICSHPVDDDPTYEYVERFSDVREFLTLADYDVLQNISQGEMLLRQQCWYLDDHKPDVVWRLEDVGPLLPRINHTVDHCVWADVGRGAEAKNRSLHRFLKCDTDYFYRRSK